MNVRGRTWLGHVAVVLAGFHTLLAFGLPPLVPMLGTAALLALSLYAGARNGLLMAASLALATLLYAGMLAVVDWEQLVYYRPDEMLSTHDTRRDHPAYLPSRHVEMQVPHGDLQSMTEQDIAEPHRVVYQTDSRGFRNRSDYAGEPYLLVGDSFIAGSNNSQPDLLAEQLARDHALPAYSLAHPGDLDDYIAYVEAFRNDHGDGAKVLLFLFEGNDFPAAGRYRPRSAYPFAHRVYRSWIGLWSHTGVYRFTSSIYKRWRNRRKIQGGALVQLEPVAGRPAAFYRPYVEASRETRYEPDPRFTPRLETALALAHQVFLVPAKYRVYHPDLPRARWDYLSRLCARTATRCTDLADALAAAAAQAARSGQTVYWRDDTHWNGAGIAVAARAVARAVAAAPEQ